IKLSANLSLGRPSLKSINQSASPLNSFLETKSQNRFPERGACLLLSPSSSSSSSFTPPGLQPRDQARGGPCARGGGTTTPGGLARLQVPPAHAGKASGWERRASPLHGAAGGRLPWPPLPSGAAVSPHRPPPRPRCRAKVVCGALPVPPLQHPPPARCGAVQGGAGLPRSRCCCCRGSPAVTERRWSLLPAAAASSPPTQPGPPLPSAAPDAAAAATSSSSSSSPHPQPLSLLSLSLPPHLPLAVPFPPAPASPRPAAAAGPGRAGTAGGSRCNTMTGIAAASFFSNACRFGGCGLHFPTLAELIEHIEDNHIDTDPRVLEKQELQQPTYVALSYINRTPNTLSFLGTSGERHTLRAQPPFQFATRVGTALVISFL
uniref:JAZF zinc finger 1 n=1 Tax=Anas zonorhyncha TaxID=75864 RepID=A0A8B9U161_9AVES